MNKHDFSKVLGIFVLALTIFLGLTAKAMAFTPTLSVVNLSDPYGGGSIQLIVNADPSSNVYLYSSSPTSGYIDIIGHTNGNGYLSATIAPTGYRLTPGQVIYVAVNGQASNSVTWPSLNPYSVNSYNGTNYPYNYNYNYPSQNYPVAAPVTYPNVYPTPVTQYQSTSYPSQYYNNQYYGQSSYYPQSNYYNYNQTPIYQPAPVYNQVATPVVWYTPITSYFSSWWHN